MAFPRWHPEVSQVPQKHLSTTYRREDFCAASSPKATRATLFHIYVKILPSCEAFTFLRYEPEHLHLCTGYLYARSWKEIKLETPIRIWLFQPSPPLIHFN